MKRVLKKKLDVTTMSTRGQVVIPQGIREQLKLKLGTDFVVRLRDGKIILEVAK